MQKLTTDQIQLNRLDPASPDPHLRLPVCAVLENVRSLYNVGSMFRTADAALVKEIMLTGYTPRPPRKEIEKTALGATKTVPWRYVELPTTALEMLRNEGYTICAMEMTSKSLSLYRVPNIPASLALVFGNEITGVSEEALKLCDMAWEIPMYGTKHSLNVSVAFGISVFEVSRRLR